jgi:diguanylate cyclase (GGDEF)-like protein
MSEAVGPIWEDLGEHLDGVAKYWGQVRGYYNAHEWFRSMVHGVGALLAIVALDLVAGHPVGFRFLFIVPVFIASFRGDRVTSALVTGATFVALMAFDYRYGVLDALGVIVNLVALGATSIFIVTMQRQIQQIHDLANRDALTGAMSRTALQSYAEAAIAGARESGAGVVVGVIDCDGFKEVNDVYGHAAGDEILMLLVRTLQRYLGEHGALGRIGGDEFVVVLDDRSDEFACRMMERAREDYVRDAGGLTTKKGFSYGLAVLGRDGESYGSLLHAADQKMYVEKAVGEEVRYALTLE